MYLSICTRPDISFAVKLMSKFSANPALKHWTDCCKHLLRYLLETSTLQIFGYSEWASDLEERQSTTEYNFMSKVGAISWTQDSSRL